MTGKKEFYLKNLYEGIIGVEKNSEYFKKLIKKMYKGFPNSLVQEHIINEFITTRPQRDFFVEWGLFRREIIGGIVHYSLGPSAVHLISAWNSEESTKKTEELTKKIHLLTWILAIFGTLAFGVALVQLLISI